MLDRRKRIGWEPHSEETIDDQTRSQTKYDQKPGDVMKFLGKWVGILDLWYICFLTWNILNNLKN